MQAGYERPAVTVVVDRNFERVDRCVRNFDQQCVYESIGTDSRMDVDVAAEQAEPLGSKRFHDATDAADQRAHRVYCSGETKRSVETSQGHECRPEPAGALEGRIGVLGGE